MFNIPGYLDFGSGCRHFIFRSVGIALLQIDPPDCVLQQGYGETVAERIQDSFADTVVGGYAADKKVSDSVAD